MTAPVVQGADALLEGQERLVNLRPRTEGELRRVRVLC